MEPLDPNYRDFRDEILDRIMDELDDASKQGAFGIPNEESVVGKLVITEGGEYDRGIVITVAEIDTGTGITICETVEGGRYVIPVDNLRDPNAISEEICIRYAEELQKIAQSN